MDKKDRNSRVVQIYTDNGKNIDETVKIIEKIPELAKTFAGKNMRRSCIGILGTVPGLWVKLEKPVKKVKDEPTKKELATIFAGLIDSEISEFPTLLNMKKVEIARLISAVNSVISESMILNKEVLATVEKYIDKVESAV